MKQMDIVLPWIILLMSLISLNAVSKTEAPHFTKIPGNIHAQLGQPITLVWGHTISEEQDPDCYWEYDDLDPIQKPKFLLSYAAGVGVRPGEDIAGWDVTNKDRPCFGGIRKGSAGPNDAGYYTMGVGRLHSEESKLQIYNVSQMLMKITFGNVINNISAKTTKKIFQAIPWNEEDKYDMEVNLNDNFPPTTYISMKRYQGDIQDFEVLCNESSMCQAALQLRMESDVRTVVEIDTGLNNYPTLHFEQSIEYNGAVNHNAAGTTIPVVLLVLVILGLIVVIAWMRFGDNKFNEKNKSTWNIAIGLARAQCYSYYYYIVPLAAQVFNDSHQSEEHVETCDKVLILITTSGKHVTPEKLDKISLEGEIAVGEPPMGKVLVYNINGNGKVWRVMIDQPRNLATIRMVYEEKKVLKQQQRTKGIKHYSICLDDVLRKRESCCDRYKLVIFEDTKPGPGLAQLILSNIQEGTKRNSHTLHITGKSVAEVHGLAVSYCYGYIKEVLQDLEAFVTKIRKHGNEGVETFNKFIILVQESGELRNFNIQDHIEKQEESKFRLTVKISESNLGYVDVFRVTDPGDDTKDWYVMVEHPRIISVLNKMLEERDGLYSIDDKKEAIRQFTSKVHSILNRLPGCKDKYEILTYKGSSDENELATLICNKIKGVNVQQKADDKQENGGGEEQKRLMQP